MQRLRGCVPGQRVRVLVVTDGAASGNSTVIAPEQLAVLRRNECVQAGAELGLAPEDIVFLDFPDMGASRLITRIAAVLRLHIEDFRPTAVFSAYGDDVHPDHRAVAWAVALLCREGVMTCPVYEYPVSFWPFAALRHLWRVPRLRRLRRIDAAAQAPQKRLAMRRHRSQVENLTGEAAWFHFAPYQLKRYFRSYEIFFEKSRS